MERADLLQKAEEAARAAGALLRGRAASVLLSEGKDIKLDVDKEAHALVLEQLAATGIPVLSEEDSAHNFGRAHSWVVDPLDGSLNFLRGIPYCAVSIALLEEGEPVVGVVYDFGRDELFSGAAGVGAFLNGRPIAVAGEKNRSEAVLATGFPSGADYFTEALQTAVSHIQTFKKVRLFGSAALSLAYVACGRVDAYHERDIYVWDVAAGLALVAAAGGAHTSTAVGATGKCTVSAAAAPALLL